MEKSSTGFKKRCVSFNSRSCGYWLTMSMSRWNATFLLLMVDELNLPKKFLGGISGKFSRISIFGDEPKYLTKNL